MAAASSTLGLFLSQFAVRRPCIEERIKALAILWRRRHLH